MITRRQQPAVGYQPGGEIIQQWTQQRVRAAIDATSSAIRQALRSGDVDLAMVLVSKQTGLRICAGDITVRLKPPPKQF
jgi:hypothetical protein